MIELGVIRDLVAIFGVIAGFSYYVLTVRNAERNQKQQLETRKIAIYNNYVDKITNKEYIDSYLSIMYNQKWDDFDEWWEKYGPNNQSAYNDFIKLLMWFQHLGTLYEQGVIEIDMLYYDRGFAYIRLWEHLTTPVKGYRDKMDNQYAFYHGEQLYIALLKFEQTLSNT